MATHGMACNPLLLGDRKRPANQRVKLLGHVIIHLEMRRPERLRGVYVKARALTQIIGFVIGHVFAAPPPRGREAGYDDKHELVGALWLRNAFVPEVSEPVLHHVPAKRYLVATRKEYWDHLKQDSRDSLMQQGGPMQRDEIDSFRAQPFWEEGVRVRIWDDDAKSWLTRLESLERYRPQLEACLLA